MAFFSPRTVCALAGTLLGFHLPMAAHADVMKDAAWIDCDPGNDRLTVRYGAVSASDPTATVFWSLIRYSKRPDGDAEHVEELMSTQRSCRLSGGNYIITFWPVPMNYNLHGLCGGIVRGEVAIALDQRMILPRTEMETGDCAGPVASIRDIVVSGNDGRVTVRRVSD